MKSICIIPARSGSKRIPRKNIKNFCGRPIISYSIFSALDSNIFDEVMVSTDDKEIAEISLEYGANVPFMRSEKASDDFATTMDVIEEVIEEYNKLGQEFDIICCLYPCAPFVTGKSLEEGMSIFYNTPQVDSVMPVCRYPVPIEWALELTDDNVLKPTNRESLNIRSQDLKEKYFDVGQWYLVRNEVLDKSKLLIGENCVPVIIDEQMVQDIDSIEDWKQAELKFKFINES